MIEIILPAFDLSDLEPSLSQVFKTVRRCIRHIREDYVERVGLLRNRHVEDGTVLLLDAFESQVELTDAINAQIAAILVLLQSHTDFQGLAGISPVEDRRLLGENLELAKLFTVRLDYIQCMEGAVDHKESRLEADQLGE